jgi:hypothetical protein
MKDKKAACFRKQISPGFFVQKLCSLWHLQVASAVLVVLVAICKSQLAVHKKSLEKAAWKNVDSRSQICFATFIQRKVTKLLTTQQPLKLKKKINTFWSFRIFQCMFDHIKKTLLNNMAHRFLFIGQKIHIDREQL